MFRGLILINSICFSEVLQNKNPVNTVYSNGDTFMRKVPLISNFCSSKSFYVIQLARQSGM